MTDSWAACVEFSARPIGYRSFFASTGIEVSLNVTALVKHEGEALDGVKIEIIRNSSNGERSIPLGVHWP
jgi:hypothetical protein